MPRVPVYTLAWSPVTATYELYQTRDREGLKILPESPAWFAWLEQVSSFAFVGKSGRYTARKEAKQRGDRYWSAYLATGEHLTKKYLGKTANLILARLEQVAGVLEAEQIASRRAGQETPPPLPPASVAQMPPPETLASASTDAEVEATQRPLSAQRDTPLHPLLATKLHVPRPRTRLVSRAHLVKRLQQGMARQLTLVSAPAGFGKTTLLAQWFAQSDLPRRCLLNRHGPSWAMCWPSVRASSVSLAISCTGFPLLARHSNCCRKRRCSFARAPWRPRSAPTW